MRIDDDGENTFIDSMAKKYMGLDEYPFHQPGDHRVVNGRPAVAHVIDGLTPGLLRPTAVPDIVRDGLAKNWPGRQPAVDQPASAGHG